MFFVFRSKSDTKTLPFFCLPVKTVRIAKMASYNNNPSDNPIASAPSSPPPFGLETGNGAPASSGGAAVGAGPVSSTPSKFSMASVDGIVPLPCVTPIKTLPAPPSSPRARFLLETVQEAQASNAAEMAENDSRKTDPLYLALVKAGKSPQLPTAGTGNGAARGGVAGSPAKSEASNNMVDVEEDWRLNETHETFVDRYVPSFQQPTRFPFPILPAVKVEPQSPGYKPSHEPQASDDVSFQATNSPKVPSSDDFVPSGNSGFPSQPAISTSN